VKPFIFSSLGVAPVWHFHWRSCRSWLRWRSGVAGGTCWRSAESAIPASFLRINPRLGCKRSRVQISPARPF